MLNWIIRNKTVLTLTLFIVLMAGTVEYTDIPNECPRYDTKLSDGEEPVILEIWGMWSTPSLPFLPGLILPGMLAPDRALSMG